MATTVAERLFDLLREEAGEAAFLRLVDESNTKSEVTPTPGEIGHVVELALEVRRRLAECRQRTAELIALYETAHDLTALRDLEKVLEAIVERSQRLLSTDVAYLMLIDEERGDTYMRSTRGTVTPGFPNIRLPLGLGLGGLVAQTGTPYATTDYTSDPRFVHVIDDIVIEERIAAILGVPLMIGRRVIGVLFAADRHPRHFDVQEISLLASLAANAAVAIENASLFQEARSAIDGLTEANARLQAQNAAIERASELHERLTKLVLGGTSVAELASSVVDVLNGTLVVLDDRHRMLAHAGSADGAVSLPDSVPDAVGRAIAGGRSQQVRLGSESCWLAPVVAAGSHLGTLAFVGPDLCATDLRMLERAAMVTALLMLNQRAMDEANNRIRGELLAEALQPGLRDPEGLRRRAGLIGVDLSAPHVVVAVGVVERERRNRLSARAMVLAQTVHGLSCAREDHVVMLVPGADPDQISAEMAQRLGTDTGSRVTVGGAGPVTDPVDIAAAAQMAWRCLTVLLVLGREGEGASGRQLGAYGLLLNGVQGADINQFIHSIVGPVLAYDTDRHTELLSTLEAYFAAGGHAKRAAAALFLHVNTLYQRLDRLDEILGPDWRAGDKSLQIHLALRLRRLREAGSFLG